MRKEQKVVVRAGMHWSQVIMRKGDRALWVKTQGGALSALRH